MAIFNSDVTNYQRVYPVLGSDKAPHLFQKLLDPFPFGFRLRIPRELNMKLLGESWGSRVKISAKSVKISGYD